MLYKKPWLENKSVWPYTCVRHVICLLHEQIRADLAHVSSHLRCKRHRFRSGAANCCNHKFHCVLQQAAATTTFRWRPDLVSFGYGMFEGMCLYIYIYTHIHICSKYKKPSNTQNTIIIKFQNDPSPQKQIRHRSLFEII